MQSIISAATQNKIGYSINISLWDIWVFIVVLVFFKPQIAEDIVIIDLCFNAGRFGLAIWYTSRMLFQKGKVSKFWLLFSGIAIVVFISTIMIGEDYAKALTHYVPSLGLIAFLSIYKNKIERILLIVMNMGIFLLVTNLLSVLMFPNGLLYREANQIRVWILGQKQDFGGFVLCFLFAILCIKFRDKKVKNCNKFWFILILGIISAIVEQTLGAIISLAVFVLLFLLDKYIMKINRSILVVALAFLFIVIQYVCFNFEDMTWLQALLSNIDVNGVTKLRTINVRFGMWRFAWETIMQHPIIGVGKLTVDNWNSIANVGYHSMLDNMFMDILMTGGLVAFSLFVALIVESFGALKNIWHYREGREIGYCLFSLCILLYGGCPYFPSVFFVFSIPIWFKSLIDKAVTTKL